MSTEDQCSAVIMVNDTHVFSVNGPRDRFTYRVDRDDSTLVLTATLHLDDAPQERATETIEELRAERDHYRQEAAGLRLVNEQFGAAVSRFGRLDALLASEEGDIRLEAHLAEHAGFNMASYYWRMISRCAWSWFREQLGAHATLQEGPGSSRSPEASADSMVKPSSTKSDGASG